MKKSRKVGRTLAAAGTITALAVGGMLAAAPAQAAGPSGTQLTGPMIQLTNSGLYYTISGNNIATGTSAKSTAEAAAAVSGAARFEFPRSGSTGFVKNVTPGSAYNGKCLTSNTAFATCSPSSIDQLWVGSSSGTRGNDTTINLRNSSTNYYLSTDSANGKFATSTAAGNYGWINASGLVAPASADVVISAPATGTTVGMKGATFTGTATPNSTVEITDSTGKVVGTATTDATGNWSTTLTLPDGPANFTFTSGTKSATWSGLVIDDSAPLIVTTPKAGSTLVSSQVEFTGTAEPGATVTIKDADGKTVGSTVAGVDGAYKVTVTLPEGSTSATVEAGSRSVKVEDLNVIAKLEVTTPTPDATIGTNGTEFTGTGQPGEKVVITDKDGTVLGQTTIDDNGEWTTTVKVPEGSAPITVTAGDQTVILDKLTVVDDTAALVVTTPQGGATIVGPDVTFDGTGQPGDTVAIKDADGKTIGETTVNPDGSWNATVPLPGGGTVTVESGDQTVTIEDLNVIAKLEVTTPTPDATIGTIGTEFTGTGQPGEKVVIADKDGNVLGMTTIGDNGEWTTSVKVPEGSAPITVTAGDQTVILDRLIIADDTEKLEVTTP
ncbi:Ig-like domain-containing protein, partial [Leifsonia aquatica]|uniref:Ig-like domain-containing protein n=1 Tax=Leifsonia aquatica TaxID=144185 RepID=UPI0013B3B667